MIYNDLNIGDTFKVSNNAGVFTVKILNKIQKDIGLPYNSLGEFKKLRIEFYDGWISIFDQNNEKYIYFSSIPQYNQDEALTYKCEIIQEEVQIADLIRYELKGE